jgi:hypothetical protein
MLDAHAFTILGGLYVRVRGFVLTSFEIPGIAYGD